MISIDEVGIDFKSGKKVERVVDNVSFTILENEFVALTGPSGIGKSTIASVIAGILKPTAGTVSFEGRIITGKQIPDVVFINQDSDLFPWMKVGKQIEFALKGTKTKYDRNSIKDLLNLVELSRDEKKYPHQLSTGMQRRLSIARAVAVRPKLIILDEPFAALDNAIKQKIFDDLVRLRRTYGMSILLISHNADEVNQLADREIILSVSKPTKIETIREVKR